MGSLISVRVVRETFPGKVLFEQTSELSEAANHVNIGDRSVLAEGPARIKTLRGNLLGRFREQQDCLVTC